MAGRSGTLFRLSFVLAAMLAPWAGNGRAAEQGYGFPLTAAPLNADEAFLRPYANGAGPSAIFRFGRTAGGQDLFGIVDPVGWRIQFFALDDWSIEGARPLSERIHWSGACRLDPGHRVWRVHVRPDRTVLQLQPDPTLEEIETNAPLRFPKIDLRADAATIAALAAPASPRLDDRIERPCSGSADDAAPPFFTAADAAVAVTGGDSEPFRITRTALPARASPFLREQITLGTAATAPLTRTGGVLTSVQELEPARSVSSDRELRHFLLTARSDALPGFAHSVVVLVRRSAGGGLDGVMRLDTGLARVKTGQRFAAVSSKGEVLVIGTSDKNAFRIRACHFTDVPHAQSLCTLPDIAPAGVVAERPGAGAPAPTTGADVASRRAMWDRARWYVSQRYRFDASGLTATRCRSAVAPCSIGRYANAWTVISPLRLAENWVERRGVPYAQRQTIAGIPTLDRPAADLPYERSADGRTILMPAHARRGNVDYVVGDINNDGLPDDAPDLKLFGIDCSAFLAVIWGVAPRPTDDLITAANDRAIARVPSFGALTFGDAFVINLSDRGHRLTNHVALFRERRPAGPADSSQGVLVLESSSGCGGVCTTLYDESYFDGWALISRGTPSPDVDFATIPLDYPAWRRLMQGA
ncbi:MAG: hypothetical protein ABIO86_09600 [Sphingomonas sp.]